MGMDYMYLDKLSDFTKFDFFMVTPDSHHHSTAVQCLQNKGGNIDFVTEIHGFCGSTEQTISILTSKAMV